MIASLRRASVWVVCCALAACAPRAVPEDAAFDGLSPTDAVSDTVPPPDSARADASVCRATAFESRLDLRYHTVSGVDPNLLSLDLYLPTLAPGCAPPPLVVYVHGGAWVVGDKRNQIDTKVRYFTGEGYAFASVNYRLSPAMAGQPGVRYPVHNQDAARALAWLRSNAGTYGYRAEGITLFGHSAGAGIVTLVGTDPQFLTEQGRSFADLSCVVSLDTEAYDVTTQAMEPGQPGMIYRNAFGSDPMVWSRASPLSNGTLAAGSNIVPFLVVTRGEPARRALSQRLVDALRAAGVRATLHTAERLTHEGVTDAVGLAGDTALMPVFGPFVSACARGQ
ncbi:MAG: alpha/beta hydrolase [Deltaproteobacteria bacterium]|nr:alpha/beta hydrolase [Deltaproteobacteria bacterium]